MEWPAWWWFCCCCIRKRFPIRAICQNLVPLLSLMRFGEHILHMVNVFGLTKSGYCIACRQQKSISIHCKMAWDSIIASRHRPVEYCMHASPHSVSFFKFSTGLAPLEVTTPFIPSGWTRFCLNCRQYSLSLIAGWYSGMNLIKNAPLLPVLLVPFSALQMVIVRCGIEWLQRGRRCPLCINRPYQCSLQHAKHLSSVTPLFWKRTSAWHWVFVGQY